MAVYWNFREILDVYPEKHPQCVAMNKDGKTRCQQSPLFFSRDDLRQAEELLDRMDRRKDLKSSYQQLDDLAFLLLCPRNHKNLSKVEAVCGRWRLLIAQQNRRMAVGSRET